MIVTRHLLAAGLSGKSVVHGRVASHRPESVFPPDPLAPMRVCMPRSIKSRTQSLPSGGPQVSCIMCALHPAPMRAECGHISSAWSCGVASPRISVSPRPLGTHAGVHATIDQKSDSETSLWRPASELHHVCLASGPHESRMRSWMAWTPI